MLNRAKFDSYRGFEDKSKVKHHRRLSRHAREMRHTPNILIQHASQPSHRV